MCDSCSVTAIPLSPSAPSPNAPARIRSTSRSAITCASASVDVKDLGKSIAKETKETAQKVKEKTKEKKEKAKVKIKGAVDKL